MSTLLTLLLAVPSAWAAPVTSVLSVPLPGKGRAVDVRRGPCKDGSCSLRLVLKEGGREAAAQDLASDAALAVYDGKIEPNKPEEGDDPLPPGFKSVIVAPVTQDPELGGAVVVAVQAVSWAPGVAGFVMDLSSMVAAEGVPTSEYAGVAVKDGKILPLWRGNSYQMADEDFLTSVDFMTRKAKGGGVEAVFTLTKGTTKKVHGVLRWDAAAGKLVYGAR